MHAKTESKPKTNPTSRDAISPDVGSSTPTAKEKTTMSTSKKTTPKVSHAKTKAPELLQISSVKLVPLELIDVLPQVRTVFDQESIQELADDIAARGLLQPILLNPKGARFELIAGERRLRAMKLINFTEIPALITKTSSGDALLMQLAENIQRENLDLGDEVKTIRLLHDNLKNVKEVAETVKKSPSWVSKRLALSHPDFNYMARQLLEDGITEDVEILNLVSQLGQHSWGLANTACANLRTGKVTRDELREILATTKANQPKPVNKITATRTAAEIELEKKLDNEIEEKIKADRKEREEGTGDTFIKWAWNKLDDFCMASDTKENFRASTFYNNLQLEQRKALSRHVKELKIEFKEMSLSTYAKKLSEYEYTLYLEEMVFYAAMKEMDIEDNLQAFFDVIETANKKP